MHISTNPESAIAEAFSLSIFPKRNKVAPLPAEPNTKVIMQSAKNSPIFLQFHTPNDKKTYRYRISSAEVASSIRMRRSTSNFPVISQFDPIGTLENAECPENNLLIHEEPKTTEELQCRICLDTDNPEDLISPCKCKGYQKMAHQACIKAWLLASEKYETEISSCEVCKARYNMEFMYSNVLAPCSENSWKFWVPFFIACVLIGGILSFYFEGYMEGTAGGMLILTISLIFAIIALCCLFYSFKIIVDVCFDFKISGWEIKNFQGV